MKKLISLLLCAVLLCASLSALTSCGGTKYNVGIIQLAPHEALDAATQGFKDALIAELGEDNITFHEQNAGGEIPACTTIASTLVAKNLDLIMANATPALQAVANATNKIPILGTSVTEYGVALGIENFTGTVGTNVSGTSDLAPLKEQAEMLVDIFPDAKTVGLLYCSSEPNSDYQVKVMKDELEAKGITCKEYKFNDSNDIKTYVEKAVADKIDVMYIPTDNTAANNVKLIEGAIGNIPVIAGEPGICKGCGVATLGISYYDLGVATGKMAAKILKGEADVSDMAIEYAPASKMYNAEKCEELGIDIEALKAKGYKEVQ